jgi:V8-like Glu-specific endopeptidase
LPWLLLDVSANRIFEEDMKFFAIVGVLLFSIVSSAQVFDSESAVIDYGMLKPAIVNGAEVPDSLSILRDMTPRIYILDTSEQFAIERYCTGLLIAPDVVLTAAHCLSDDPSHVMMQVYFQDKVVDVKGFVSHPEYQPLKTERIHGKPMVIDGYNDVGLIFLEESMNSNPIALLPQQGYHIKDKVKGTILGYGYIGPDEPNSSGQLRYVDVSIKEISKGRLRIEGPKTSCSGDSGGPILVKNGDRWLSIGITSAGDCVDTATPMRTSHYSDWIQEQIQKMRSTLRI